MSLLTLNFPKHSHGLVRIITFYALKSRELFRWSTVQQFCCTPAAPALVLATFENKTAHLMYMEPPARYRAEKEELNNEGETVRAKVSSRVDFCLKETHSSCTETRSRRSRKRKKRVRSKGSCRCRWHQLKEKKKSPTRRGGVHNDGACGAESKEIETDADEEKEALGICYLISIRTLLGAV